MILYDSVAQQEVDVADRSEEHYGRNCGSVYPHRMLLGKKSYHLHIIITRIFGGNDAPRNRLAPFLKKMSELNFSARNFANFKTLGRKSDKTEGLSEL